MKKVIENFPYWNLEKFSWGSLIEKNSQFFLKELLFIIALIPKLIQTLAIISAAKNLLIDAEIY